MSDRQALTVGAVIWFVGCLLTLADHRTGNASTTGYDYADRAKNPRKFRSNMRWNIGLLVIYAVLLLSAAYDSFSK
jgi:hypothetical protein